MRNRTKYPIFALALFFFFLGLLTVSKAQPADGSVAPADLSVSSAAVSTPVDARATTSASGATPLGTSSPVSPKGSGSIVPSVPPNQDQSTLLSTPEPISATPEENNNLGILALLGGAVLAIALAATVVYQKRNIKKSASPANDTEKKEENRCFDIKKIMEDKAKELLDLEEQLKGKAKEKAEGVVKEAIQGTLAGEIVAKIEKIKGEYEKFKKLYEKCIVEIHAPKRAYIVHGWGGKFDEGWFPWLKKELEQKGFSVTIPMLPDPEHPRINTWIPALAKAVGTPDRNTFFVGHSMGCQTIARYLETLPEDTVVGGVVFVAGFFKRLTGLEDDPETRATEQHWLNAPIDFAKIKTRAPKSMALFSDNDEFVPSDNYSDFKEHLGSEIMIEKAKGHFSGSDGIVELPFVLESLIKLSK